MINCSAQGVASPWPKPSPIHQPWARWWWMGSAVDKDNLKRSLIEFHQAGIGGVEITPIYGVKGQEKNNIDYLSPKWMEMLDYSIKVADSLQMKIDMVLGTGWPYGGPNVTTAHAASKLIVEKFTLNKGESIDKTIALDAEKGQLLYVLAYGSDGSYQDLSPLLQNNKENPNRLQWKALQTNYTLYSVYCGKTGQMVKRAAPAGEGFSLDHYSREAFQDYGLRFDKALKGREGKLRAIFNDSYEVYGSDFTARFFDEFKSRRGYDLKPYLASLLQAKDTEISNRIRADYRQTLSDLLLNQFNNTWTEWANAKNYKTRLQAHGSPGNLIDLYASADIPECETFGSMPFDIPGLRREKEDIREGDADPIMLKFASSAAHISGKKLVSSESFTWLREHFKTALSQCKPEAEELMLNGINHLFLHGSTYSPSQAKWPGWTFYASVNFNSNNTIWEDAPSLFSYISNCQSMLQQGNSDHETLVYWPIFDTWDKYHQASLFFQFKIHSLAEWLYQTPFYDTSKALIKKGYGLDFISDAFIEKAKLENGKIVLEGGSYKSLVVPSCKKMPLATLRKLIDLRKRGASIIFESLPESVPGFYQYKEQEAELKRLIAANEQILRPSEDIEKSLKQAQIDPESLVETGLKYNRRTVDGEKLYFLVNHTSKTIEGFIPLQVPNKEVLIFDPLTKEYGNARVRKTAISTEVYLKIKPGQSYFLKTENRASQKSWTYYQPVAAPYNLEGNWQLQFDKGGPQLPASASLSSLESWTKLSPEAQAFSGSASYTLEFKNPNPKVKYWSLNLGDVRESAKVWLNETYLGTAWSLPYTLYCGKLKRGKNNLKIQVTNLAANRLRDLERKGEQWKIFNEINMVDKDYKKFDATPWKPMPSGLLGPLTLSPLEKQNESSPTQNENLK